MRIKGPASKNQAQKSPTRRHAVHGDLRIYANSKFAWDAIWSLVGVFKLERTGLSVAIMHMHFSRLKRKDGMVELTASRWDSLETLSDLFQTNIRTVSNKLSSLYSEGLMSKVKWSSDERCYAFSLTFILWLKRESERRRTIAVIRNRSSKFKSIPSDNSLLIGHCLMCPSYILMTNVNASSPCVDADINASSPCVDSESVNASSPCVDNSVNALSPCVDSASTHTEQVRQRILTMPYSNSERNSELKKEEEEELKKKKIKTTSAPTSVSLPTQNEMPQNVHSINKRRTLKDRSFWGVMKEDRELQRSQARMDHLHAPLQDKIQSQPMVDRSAKAEATSESPMPLRARDLPSVQRERFFAVMAKLISEQERHRLLGALPEKIFQTAWQIANAANYAELFSYVETALEGDDTTNAHAKMIDYAKGNGLKIEQVWKVFIDKLPAIQKQKK